MRFSIARGLLLLSAAAIASAPAGAQLTLVPDKPASLDTIRLRWAHVGCTNPDSVRMTVEGNHITVSADRLYVAGCGTARDHFDEYALGPLPAGEYDVELVVNPPPPTRGTPLRVGTVRLSIGPPPKP